MTLSAQRRGKIKYKICELPPLSRRHQIARDRYIKVAKQLALVLRANKKPTVKLELEYANALERLRMILYEHNCYEDNHNVKYALS